MSNIIFRGATRETVLAKFNVFKKSVDDLKKMNVNGPGRSKLGPEEIPGSVRSMHGYILTYSRPSRQKICLLWVLKRGDRYYFFDRWVFFIFFYINA